MIDCYIVFILPFLIGSFLSCIHAFFPSVQPSCFAAIWKDCFLSILFSCFHSSLKSCYPAVLKSCFQPFSNPASKADFCLSTQLSILKSAANKRRKTPVSRSVRRCPHLSPFVHQLAILQHFKSPLLCSGVTNRKGRANENGRVCRRVYRCTLTPIRP